MICSFIWSSGQIVNLVPNVFPDTPTSYLELERVTSSKVFVAPEDGWFEFIGLAASGKGGREDYASWGEPVEAGGGSGGAGGIVVSVFPLNAGDTVSLSIGTNVSISTNDETATATAGTNGGDGKLINSSTGGVGGSGGTGGKASGGNIANQNGPDGNRGRYVTGSNSGAGQPVSNSYKGYSTTSGSGGSGTGSTAYIVVLRGNTNLPLSQLNALELSGLMLEMNYVFQEQTEMLMKSTQ